VDSRVLAIDGAVGFLQNRRGRSRMIQQEFGIGQRLRDHARQFDAIVPSAEFVLKSDQRIESLRCAGGTEIARKLDTIAKALGRDTERMNIRGRIGLEGSGQRFAPSVVSLSD
jgi:hypothetical protein